MTLWALALRFTQINSVGGESESGPTAVAVMPVRLPGLPVAITATAPACERMACR
jgi:hypothetical protein